MRAGYVRVRGDFGGVFASFSAARAWRMRRRAIEETGMSSSIERRSISSRNAFSIRTRMASSYLPDPLVFTMPVIYHDIKLLT